MFSHQNETNIKSYWNDTNLNKKPNVQIAMAQNTEQINFKQDCTVKGKNVFNLHLECNNVVQQVKRNVACITWP